jgi:hypothetical protein
MNETPLRLEWMDPNDLTEHPQNWRRHPESQKAAVAAAIDDVGWAGVMLLNEQTGHILDGHLRKNLDPSLFVDGKVPVVVGNWSEDDEKKILLTLDPLAAMADADAVQLDALLREVQTDNQDLADMLTALAEDSGMYSVGETELPSLPDGDREPFQQMTFTLHDTQAETVKAAIDKAKAAGGFNGSPNENSNGNALARIAEAYGGTG